MTENRTEVCAVLCVSPSPEDHEALARILREGSGIVHHASTLCAAKHLLQSNRYQLVICDRSLPPDAWKDVLVETASRPQAPFFIVTSVHTDDHLWTEALRWGTYDVLSKPFQPAEVVRAVNMAALHWNYRYSSSRPLTRSAAR